MVTHTKPHNEKEWRVRDSGNLSIFVLSLPNPYPQGSGIYAKKEGERSKSHKWWITSRKYHFGDIAALMEI